MGKVARHERTHAIATAVVADCDIDGVTGTND